MTSPGFAYSRAAGNTLMLSGQIAPEELRTPDSTIEVQTRAAFDEALKVLATDGLGLQHIVYVTAYVNDPADFGGYHREWLALFPSNPPARTTVSATIVVDNARVEISVIASMSDE